MELAKAYEREHEASSEQTSFKVMGAVSVESLSAGRLSLQWDAGPVRAALCMALTAPLPPLRSA
jgi:hypothetical protein